MTGVIRTLGADLPAEQAGPTYAHEHLIIDSPFVAKAMPHISLQSVDEAVAELEKCVRAGVRTMVDAMPAASGRNPEKLMQASIRTGVRMVASTGLHTSKYYDDVPWTHTESADALAARFIADVEHGIDQHDYLGGVVERTEVRAGVIKVAALTAQLTASEHRLFEAAAITHLETGVPILTHTEGGQGGLAQIETLLDLGVSPGRIALSHTDKVHDVEYHRSMLSRGVYLCYDQGLRTPKVTALLLETMTGEGFGDQLIMGTDGARRSLWSTLGGSPGLAYLYTGFAKLFDEPTDRLFTVNPSRWLTIGN